MQFLLLLYEGKCPVICFPLWWKMVSSWNLVVKRPIAVLGMSLGFSTDGFIVHKEDCCHGRVFTKTEFSDLQSRPETSVWIPLERGSEGQKRDEIWSRLQILLVLRCTKVRDALIYARRSVLMVPKRKGVFKLNMFSISTPLSWILVLLLWQLSVFDVSFELSLPMDADRNGNHLLCSTRWCGQEAECCLLGKMALPNSLVLLRAQGALASFTVSELRNVALRL